MTILDVILITQIWLKFAFYPVHNRIIILSGSVYLLIIIV